LQSPNSIITRVTCIGAALLLDASIDVTMALIKAAKAPVIWAGVGLQR
jgi:hypothetical protein